VRSFEIDPERIDGVFELIRYYTDRGMYRVAWGYYGFIRSFYEKTSDDVVAPDKLFVNPWVSGFGLPYYTILLCERTGDAETARAMYRKIFRYRFPEKNTEQINGLLLRLERFFTEELREPLLGWLGAIRLAGAVVRDDLIDRYRYHALVYTGWAPFPWNGDTPRTRALGGSEAMAAALAAGLHTRGWRVLVVGNVADTAATDDGPRYLHEDRAHGLLTACPFRLLVVSRDLTFLDRFRGVSAEKTIAWAHDVDVLGSHNLASPLSGIVFVSHWQKRLFLERYPSLPRERCLVIPNAVHPITPPEPGGRVANRFVYSSCVNRGLEKILAVWPTILAEIPDATLCVSTYNSFPRNIWEEELHRKMTALRGIKMLGSLSKQELYDTLATCEFWLYPTTFLETFCITAVEMMACGVLCVYYPVGALPETIGEGCGVPVEMGKEIETILSLSTRQKEEIRRAAHRRIRERFLWTDRIDEWIRTIGAVKAPERIKIVFDKDMPRVDGSLLRRTPYLSRLFRGAEPRPEILSHLMLWRMLRLDSAYDAYLVIDGPPAPVDAPPGPHELRVEPGRYLLPKKDAPALLDRARAGGIGDDLRGFLLGKTAQAEEEEYDHRPTIGVLSPQAPPEITGIRFVAFSTDEPLSPGGYRYQTEAELNALLCSEGVDLLYTNSVANPFRSVNACPIMHAQNAKSVIDTQGLTRVFHGLFSTGSASGNKS
jgi:glycosyltransferase involved in cell wall biosynthesis